MEQRSGKDVVVGVDGSAGSRRAVEFAALEAHRLGAALTLVHVVPDFAATSPPAYLVPTDLQRDVEKHGRELLGAATSAALSTAPEVRTEEVLCTGGVIRELVSASHGASVVVLGRETVRPLQRILDEAVTLGVAARAHARVVSVPASWDPGPPRRVVAGYKYAAHAGMLLDVAFAEAAARDARLRILHAWSLQGFYDDRISARTQGEDWSRAATADIESHIAEHRARYPRVSVDVEVVHDQAAPALLEHASDGDLIVLVRRSHGFPPATHLGATARGVLQHAPCPVLVVDPEHAEVADTGRRPVATSPA